MKKISILIPCYNEEKSLPLLYPELVKLMDANQNYEWELMLSTTVAVTTPYRN